MLIKPNQTPHSAKLVQRKMATLKIITLVVVLFHIVVNVYGLSSDETCRERLDNLERLLANLNEKLETIKRTAAKMTRYSKLFKKKIVFQKED